MADTKEFEKYVGKEFDFYGVDYDEFKLDDMVFKALEDEDDGYRSYLDSITVVNSDGIFFDKPLARVVVKEYDDGYTRGFQLVDEENGHVWLTVGTENYDDYYPYYVFRYEPKEISPHK